jgi:hypothetical protein
MLFKILNLFGLDVPAKIAAARAEFDYRVEDAAAYAKQATLTAGLVAAFSAVAAFLFVGMATRAAKYPGIIAGHYTLRLRQGLFRFATAHRGYHVGSNHPLTSGTSTPSAVAKSIWWSCSSTRICRISSAMANSPSASHCRTLAR